MGLFLLASACGHHATSHEKDSVPRTTMIIRIDGDWGELDWAKRAMRGQFRGDDGQLARPSSEVRFLRDDHDLFVALYAADENIQSNDAFDLTIGALSLHADATGHVTPTVPGVTAAVGYDEGTLDDPRDDDEEWVVELKIPLDTLSATGGQPAVRSSRCDTPKDGVKRCGSWSGTLGLE